MDDSPSNLIKLLNEGNDDAEDDAPSLLQLSPYYANKRLRNYVNKIVDSYKLISLNCQSLNSKYEEINIFFKEFCSCDFHAICLQETWLTDQSDVQLLQLNGYKLISKGKSSSEHGGVAIYLKTFLKYTVLSIDSKSNLWDGLFLEILIEDSCIPHIRKSLIVGNIYRPPRDRIDDWRTFIAELDEILFDFQRTNRDVVLVGDFNIDLLKLKEKSIINDYFETILSNSFIPKITLPTRITNNTATLIDNIFSKLSDISSSSIAGVVLVNISDHLPCFLSLDCLTVKKSNHKLVKTWSRSEQSYMNLKSEIEEKCCPSNFFIDPDKDPNLNYEILDTTLKAAFEKHIPVKLVKFNKHKHKLNNWITRGILRSIRFRDKLYRRMINTKNNLSLRDTLKANLSSYNKILKNLIRNAKKDYYESCFRKFKDDIKKTWDTIKLIINKNKKPQCIPEFFLVNGSRVSDINVIVEEFNKYFTDIGINLYENIDSPKDYSFQDYLRTPSANTFCFKKVSESEISKIIDDLKPKSSCGVDGISNKILKYIKTLILYPLTLIINQAIETGIFPDKLKLAKVIPIYKKNEDYLFENYRPISVLPSISKVIERVMHSQVEKYFSENNLFFENQYGFRKSHSTELSALELINRVLTCMDNREIPLAIFIDLSKAFDTIDHKILLSKLHYYGIKHGAWKLFESYLHNRKQFVSLDNHDSSLSTIKMGVPQGSILGPLLFIIYLNDLHAATNSFHPIICVDDTTLLASLNVFGGTGQMQERNINMELENISLWMKLNKLSLNTTKTKAMLFHSIRKKPPCLNLEIDGSTIEFVSEFNYLGIMLDKNLTWKSHIKKVSLKISKAAGIMCRMKNILPQEILLTLYNSLVLPYLTYGLLCWRSQINHLVKLQKKAVRIIANGRYNAHTDPIFKRLFLLKLTDICNLQELKFCFKLVNSQLPAYFLNDLFKRNFAVHQHNTRSSNLFTIPRVRCEFTKNSVRFFIPVAYNNCLQSIRDKMSTHSLQGFARYVKQQYINSYQSSCNERNCFVCSR